MAVIWHASSAPSWMPSAPQFSFIEQRAAEELWVSQYFVKLAGNWWGYRQNGLEAKIHMPSWDADYDWNEAYRKVRKMDYLRW